MQQTETYNGWKNRTTWALHLWLTNDWPSYQRSLKIVMHANRSQARAVESWVRDQWAYFPTIMRTDVGADLSQVDWQSIAESLAE